MIRIYALVAAVLVLAFPAGYVLQEQLFPAPPMVEFQGVATASPELIEAGEEITFSYYVRRNRYCAAGDGEVTIRWYVVEGDELVAVPRLTKTSPLAEADVSPDFAPWLLRRVTPKELWPGRWAYYPQVKCGADSVTPPPAYFTVTDASSAHLDAFRRALQERE